MRVASRSATASEPAAVRCASTVADAAASTRSCVSSRSLSSVRATAFAIVLSAGRGAGRRSRQRYSPAGGEADTGVSRGPEGQNAVEMSWRLAALRSASESAMIARRSSRPSSSGGRPVTDETIAIPGGRRLRHLAEVPISGSPQIAVTNVVWSVHFPANEREMSGTSRMIVIENDSETKRVRSVQRGDTLWAT